jgi:nucleotide-binding universal stress UspA family protein
VTEEPEYVLSHESRGAAAVVVGSRGRGALAGALLGAVGLAVAAHADCPVVVVRDGHDGTADDGPRPTGAVVGAADTPTPAQRFVYEEARRRDAPLTAVRAWRCPSHDTADHPLLAGEAERLHQERATGQLEAALADAPADVELHRRTVEGPAGRALLDASREAGLLVIDRRRPAHLGPAREGWRTESFTIPPAPSRSCPTRRERPVRGRSPGGGRFAVRTVHPPYAASNRSCATSGAASWARETAASDSRAPTLQPP